MPAKSFTTSATCFWYEEYPLGGSLTQRSTLIGVASQSQIGSFPTPRPKPLPPSTAYSNTSMRVSSTARYTTTVIANPGGGTVSRRNWNTPTAQLYVGATPVHDNGRYNEALASLRSAVLNGTWEGGVFLGELKETMRIFSSGAKVLTDFLSSIRKTKKGRIIGTWQGKRHIAENLSTMWLFVRYGVIPLMHDVHDALEVLSKKLNVYDMRCYVKSPKKMSRTLGVVDLKPGYVETLETTRIWFKAWFDPPSSYSALAKRFLDQLGLMNPASVAWELLTLSFVVDWFIDIGGYLEALGSPAGFKIYQVETNKLTMGFYTIVPTGSIVNSLKDTVIQVGSNCLRERMQYNRSLSGWPLPRPPTFDPSFTVKRVVDSVALLTGLSKRVLR